MTCKFINIDEPAILFETALDPLSVHLWDYCGFNPVMNVDPTGYWSYNRGLAIRYATNNFNKRNKFFYNYSNNDCANFVSQCLAAGGFPMDGLWYSYRYNCWASRPEYSFLPNNQRYQWNISPTWRLVVDQYEYLKVKKYISKATLVSKSSQISSLKNVTVGDLIYFRYDKNKKFTLNHVAIITRIYKNNIYYTAHTTDRLQRNLKEYFNDYKNGTVYICRIVK